MLCDDTCLYFVHKDLEYTNNLDTLSEAGIANIVTPAAVVSNSIEQLQSVMSTILAKQEQTDLAMTDIANSVHQEKRKQTSTTTSSATTIGNAGPVSRNSEAPSTAKASS